MRKLLQIGEVAQLLGVTPKAIRHYQKIGLLQEPERSEAGYRLYSARDLLRLHQIRRLQSLGLSLKHIKAVLGDPTQEHTLREVLQSLDEELTAQIQQIEERRQKIRAVLEESTLETVEHLPIVSPTFEWVKEQLGELARDMSPELWAQEAKLDELLDAFNWPDSYQEQVRQAATYMAANPEIYRQILAWSEKLATLAHLPENAPEVERLIAECESDQTFLAFHQQIVALSQQALQPEMQFSNAMSDVLATVLSPAQIRFLKAMECCASSQYPNT